MHIFAVREFFFNVINGIERKKNCHVIKLDHGKATQSNFSLSKAQHRHSIRFHKLQNVKNKITFTKTFFTMCEEVEEEKAKNNSHHNYFLVNQNLNFKRTVNLLFAHNYMLGLIQILLTDLLI